MARRLSLIPRLLCAACEEEGLAHGGFYSSLDREKRAAHPIPWCPVQTSKSRLHSASRVTLPKAAALAGAGSRASCVVELSGKCPRREGRPDGAPPPPPGKALHQVEEGRGLAGQGGSTRLQVSTPPLQFHVRLVPLLGSWEGRE